ncbi:MAG: metal-dependent transcriptional regulator [Infirmifilum sp.]|jgi:DtxR family Mn-dependent transcriptional regulator|uniref:metal-dependent transcriptional regulator n=1 Tax=Infirmifilum TaxID=2856573 RepID=UPI003C77EFB6
MKLKITPRKEDYLRAIYRITKEKGFARVRDIAKELEKKPSSVVEMVRKLQAEGYVNYEKYGGVTLTPKGKEVAEIIEMRYYTFLKLLRLILVPEDIALKDAHVLEHMLDPKTTLQFIRLVEFLETRFQNFEEEFSAYCRRKSHGLVHGTL